MSQQFSDANTSYNITSVEAIDIDWLSFTCNISFLEQYYSPTTAFELCYFNPATIYNAAESMVMVATKPALISIVHSAATKSLLASILHNTYRITVRTSTYDYSFITGHQTILMPVFVNMLRIVGAFNITTVQICTAMVCIAADRSSNIK